MDIILSQIATGLSIASILLLVALALVGILKPRQLLGWWRPAIVGLALFAAVITPSGDPITMLALTIPLVVMYFGSAGLGALILWLRRRKARKQDEAEATADQ